MPGNSYFEIGGIIIDGTAGYHHPSAKKIHRGISHGKPELVAGGIATIATRNLRERKGVPYSDFQLELRKTIQQRRSQTRRLISAAPVSTPIAVGALLVLTAAEMWTYAVGSYDMYTPEIQRYEESLTFSGMTSRVI